MYLQSTWPFFICSQTGDMKRNKKWSIALPENSGTRKDWWVKCVSTRGSTGLKDNLPFCFSFQHLPVDCRWECLCLPSVKINTSSRKCGHNNGSICGAISFSQPWGKWKVLPTVPPCWESLYGTPTDTWHKSEYSAYSLPGIRMWGLHNPYKVSMGPRIRHHTHLKTYIL